MMEFRRALTLVFAASLVSGVSCADDEDREQGPTREQMQQVAADACEHGLECGSIDAITLEECIEYKVGAYQVSHECVAYYVLDECLTTQTCEEIERLNVLQIGDCLDERDEAFDIQCVPQ
jgi:hypothetical protein